MRRAGLAIIVCALLYGLAAAGRERQGRAADLKALARQALSRLDGTLRVPGLREPVDVIRDRWGVPHIYAKNTDDLFFAQGFVLGQDRLWQLEMWRRQREGRLAEILGPAVVERDRQTRLLMYRGRFDEREWTSYHPEGRRIFTAFVNGLNAYIAQAAGNLPVEFTLTGITPAPWTPETVLLRATGLGDATAELQLARLVARVGVREANRRRMPDPWDELVVPEGLDVSIVPDELAAPGFGGGGGPRLPPPGILLDYRHLIASAPRPFIPEDAVPEPGSNNWVLHGSKTATGRPIVANDPHRDVTNPSLRYIVHLNAPGWNVIGASEPPFVGVHIGHTDRVAWGLTITGTDQHDVFVEDVNPANPDEVRYDAGEAGAPAKPAWEPLRIVREQIPVKGERPREIVLKFSRHGPILYEDLQHHRAYALRSVLSEPGTAPYLAALRLAQARDCREFLDAALSWKTPSENLICGDVDGTISFQASALTPARRGWTGRLPVPGSGRYEWDGFRTDLPRLLNPSQGFIATANNNTNVPGIPPVMFKTLNNVMFERIKRVEDVLRRQLEKRKHTIDDSKALQHDSYSLRGALEQELFRGWRAKSAAAEKARGMVASWNAMLTKDSAAAAIYLAWREQVDPKALDHFRPREERLPLVEPGLERAIAALGQSQGADWSHWRYGRMHARDFPHPFVPAFDLPAVERSGGSGAVAADGASYRQIIDVGDWDRSVATNVPGQSGQPESAFYGNLLPLWDRGEYFPLLYARERVNEAAAHRLQLIPAAPSAPGQ